MMFGCLDWNSCALLSNSVSLSGPLSNPLVGVPFHAASLFTMISLFELPYLRIL